MKITRLSKPSNEVGISLTTLDKVQLNPANAARLEVAKAANGGDPVWQARKLRETHDLLAIGQIAPHRCVVLDLDLHSDLRAVIGLQVPVPCRPDADNRLQIAPAAMLGLRYPAEAVRQPQAGTSFIQILEPREVWLAAVHRSEELHSWRPGAAACTGQLL